MGQQLQGIARWDSKRQSATGSVRAGTGVLRGWFVNTATTGTVTLSDTAGTLSIVIPSGAAAGSFVAPLDVGWSGTLTATFAAAGDITFIFR